MVPRNTARNAVVVVLYLLIISCVVVASIYVGAGNSFQLLASGADNSTASPQGVAGGTTNVTSTSTTSQSTPTPTPTSTPTATPTRTAKPTTTAQTTVTDSGYPARLQSSLKKEGLDVMSVKTQNKTATLKYTTYQTNQSGLVSEMKNVSGSYATLIGKGWDVDRLQVRVYGPGGSYAGSYYIKSSWATQYSDDKITAQEYYSKIQSTVQQAGK